jgi:hypothetical protein
MSQTDNNDWFERTWEYREEVLYPSLFGASRRGIFSITAEIITGTFKQESFDPRWLNHGVIEFAPTGSRDSWLYVTSGMSNDWEAAQPESTTPSGLGCEFVFETTQQSEWAILRMLHLMTFQILLCHGRYPGRDPLSDFDRTPLRGPIRSGHSKLTHLMVAPPSGFPREAHLDSGSFDFNQIVGISEAEAAFARSHDGLALLEMLVAQGYFPITDPDRNEVTTIVDLPFIADSLYRVKVVPSSFSGEVGATLANGEVLKFIRRGHDNTNDGEELGSFVFVNIETTASWCWGKNYYWSPSETELKEWAQYFELIENLGNRPAQSDAEPTK